MTHQYYDKSWHYVLCLSLSILIISIASPLQAIDYVHISEIMYDSPLNEVITQPPYSNGEYIELYNAGYNAVNLNGWKLLGDGSTEIYEFASVAIQSKSFLIIAYRHSRTPEFELSEVFSNIKTNSGQILYQNKITLKNTKEYIRLYDALGVLRDSIYYGNETSIPISKRLIATNADSISGNECLSVQRINASFDITGTAVVNHLNWGVAVANPFSPHTNYTADQLKTIRYVKPIQSPMGVNNSNGNGSSWVQASTDLQAMIDKSVPGDEIWVAEGIHYPTMRINWQTRDSSWNIESIKIPGAIVNEMKLQSNDAIWKMDTVYISNTILERIKVSQLDIESTIDEVPVFDIDRFRPPFKLKSGVRVYGGFKGVETDLNQRDWCNNRTVLSGQVSCSTRIKHVVVSVDCNNSTKLDGFIITKGNANQTGQLIINGKNIRKDCGGGIYNESSQVYYENIIVTNNNAKLNGGGIYESNGSSSVFYNVCINNNTAAFGAGIYFQNEYSSNTPSKSILNSILICGNRASYYGGGIYNAASNPSIQYATISGNAAMDVNGGKGGGIYNAANPCTTQQAYISIDKSIIWSNGITGMRGEYKNIYNESNTQTAYKNSNIEGSKTYNVGTNLSEKYDVNPKFTLPVSYVQAPTSEGNYIPTFYISGLTDMGVRNMSCLSKYIGFKLENEYKISLNDTINSGGSYFFDGKYLTETGTYTQYKYGINGGCDTIVELHLKVCPDLDVSLNSLPTKICAKDAGFSLSYVVYGKVLSYSLLFDQAAKNAGFVNIEHQSSTGSIYVPLPSNVAPGNYNVTVVFYGECKNLVLNRTIPLKSCLEATLGTLPKEICSGDAGFSLSYNATGNILSYSLLFSQAAKNAGFTDVNHKTPASNNNIYITFPANVRPDNYTVTIILHGVDVDLTFNVTIPIYYSASIMEQRWSDVLFVVNQDYNGGYEFEKNYEFFRNGTSIYRGTSSYIYAGDNGTGIDYHIGLPNNNLGVGFKYQALLQRKGESSKIMTCPYISGFFATTNPNTPLNLDLTISLNGNVLRCSSGKKIYVYRNSIHPSNLILSINNSNGGTTTLDISSYPKGVHNLILSLDGTTVFDKTQLYLE